jgi:hypothetical protein
LLEGSVDYDRGNLADDMFPAQCENCTEFGHAVDQCASACYYCADAGYYNYKPREAKNNCPKGSRCKLYSASVYTDLRRGPEWNNGLLVPVDAESGDELI